MIQYDVRCPICGTLNKKLYLLETEGWMECEHCNKEVKVLEFNTVIRIPFYRMDKLATVAHSVT